MADHNNSSFYEGEVPNRDTTQDTNENEEQFVDDSSNDGFYEGTDTTHPEPQDQARDEVTFLSDSEGDSFYGGEEHSHNVPSQDLSNTESFYRNSERGDQGNEGQIGPRGDDGTDGKGWTSGSYNSSNGVITFVSNDGLGFTTSDIRGSDGSQGVAGVGVSSITQSGTTLTITDTDGTVRNFTLEKGDKGDKGDQGDSITGPTGDAFVYSDFTASQLTALTGPQGLTGPVSTTPGPTGADSTVPGPSLGVGNVTSSTLSTSSGATAVITKTGDNLNFAFGLPIGEEGPKGDDGDDGTPGENGDPGAKGDDGDKGQQGDGWTSAYYDAAAGHIDFQSNDGLGFTTGDLRGEKGADGAPGGTPDWFTRVTGATSKQTKVVIDSNTQSQESTFRSSQQWKVDIKSPKSSKFYSDSDFTSEVASRY